MKIKLAILEKDKSYLSRIVSVFGTKYSDKFEIYSFTDQEVALSNLNTAKIDVLIASDCFDVDVSKLPARCGFAYLVDSVDIDMVNNQRAICKFQKADLIYKQILSVYSEKASSITGFKMNSDEGKVILFCSPSGGVGCSTAAAACAVHMASSSKKTLYLNLEKFGSSDLFFKGQGQFDMSDIIFALKSKKANLHIKLESCVKQDASGVHFYSHPKVALDMMELSIDEILRLLSEIQLMGEYAYIIIDADFSLSKDALKLYREARDIVLVGDGSELSNNKLRRAYEALSIMEQNADAPLVNRMSFMYNKASSKTGQSVEIQGLRELGGAPKYERATTAQILAQLAPMDLFDKIL